ncbi:unnamed protein product [Peronospora belbahrii]|uniref:Homeobox domain-containing protein n=1 Tax=Peronospora belbahrii TaxID=622444 RepID=A0AAU9KLM9_9STRA|nr:unnamed protein product [Peronospora belbahrii]CAH0473849.1 unnamed protein product [Peronospora belbahrii]CAH0517622.1 unnamed protein product [Peronospora belbahrii]CAH0517627.1 unnamed protein product [Peronospora belbahrii]
MAPKESQDVYEGTQVSTTEQQFQTRSTTPKRSIATVSSICTEAASASCVRHKKRQRSSFILNECEISSKKVKKRLRWSTITIHEFGVGLGGSTVPGKGGPSIGLSDKPEFTWTTKVGQMAECVEGVHRFTSDERVQLLQNAGVSEGMILRFTREANIINCSRRRTLVEGIAERKEAKKQRRLQIESSRSVLERPCSSSVLNRPHVIPINYV